MWWWSKTKMSLYFYGSVVQICAYVLLNFAGSFFKGDKHNTSLLYWMLKALRRCSNDRKHHLRSQLRLFGTQIHGIFVPIIRMFQLSSARMLYELPYIKRRVLINGMPIKWSELYLWFWASFFRTLSFLSSPQLNTAGLLVGFWSHVQLFLRWSNLVPLIVSFYWTCECLGYSFPYILVPFVSIYHVLWSTYLLKPLRDRYPCFIIFTNWIIQRFWWNFLSCPAINSWIWCLGLFYHFP